MIASRGQPFAAVRYDRSAAAEKLKRTSLLKHQKRKQPQFSGHPMFRSAVARRRPESEFLCCWKDSGTYVVGASRVSAKVTAITRGGSGVRTRMDSDATLVGGHTDTPTRPTSKRRVHEPDQKPLMVVAACRPSPCCHPRQHSRGRPTEARSGQLP
jgi:hypothetical protein